VAGRCRKTGGHSPSRIAVFFHDPNLGCASPDEPQFQYGATEMVAAIAGNWTFTITPNGGTATAMTIQFDEADNVPGATAQASGRSLDWAFDVPVARSEGIRSLGQLRETQDEPRGF
jgi:hypothetical protein